MWGVGLVGASRLARATEMAEEIARAEPGSPLRARRHLVASEAQLTSTGVAIVAFAAPGESPSVVVKLPMNERAADRLARESGALSAIHSDERLGRWREVIPRPHAAGIYCGQRYRIESAIDGRNGTELLADPEGHRTALREAVEAIALLHEATACTVEGDRDLAWRWVGVHIAELTRHIGQDRRPRLALERIGAELADAVAGATLSASRIHGDYWLGNLIFARSDARPLVGIVDWDASGNCELPLHDMLHLLFYTRRLCSGRELGEIVIEQLLAGRWSADERRPLMRHPMWSDEGPVSGRAALLLYWLRHVAMHARQQSSHAGLRYRMWHRRNVLPVLEAL